MTNLPSSSPGFQAFSIAPSEDPSQLNEAIDLVDFLDLLRRYDVNILPITWQEAIDPFAGGGSADISQSMVNVRTNFAFKRFIDYPARQSNVLRYIASEVLVLQQQSIRNHPNFMELVGVCWEFGSEPEVVLPVLVYPKVSADLSSFMARHHSADISYRERIDICTGVGEALLALHNLVIALDHTEINVYIVHGDIKPENILVLQEVGKGVIAKLIDFAFASFQTSKNGKIRLPQGVPWTRAPEWHPRAMAINAAKKMDIFSFGTLSAWTLFCHHSWEKSQPSHGAAFADCLQALKTRDQLLDSVLGWVDTSMPDSVRAGLTQFFSLTLSQDPQRRIDGVGDLLSHLNPSRLRENFAMGPWTSQPHVHIDLRICKIILQLLWIDYRLRNRLFSQLLERATTTACEECRQSMSYQVAFCYFIGIGTARSEQTSMEWLGRSQKTRQELLSMVETADAFSIFSDGLFLQLWLSGNISPTELDAHYRRYGLLSDAEKQYRREKADLEMMGKDHFLYLTVCTLLADTLRNQDKLDEACELYAQILEAVQNDPVGSSRSWTTILNLALVLDEMGKWRESERLLRGLSEAISAKAHHHHLTRTSCLIALACVTEKLGMHEDAEHLARQALEECQNNFGSDHVQTLKAVGNLAIVLPQNGDLKEIEALERVVLNGNIKLLGEEHQDTQTAMSNLAVTFKRQGKWKDAQELFEQVYSLNISTLGHRHQNTINTHGQLAGVYISQDKLVRAEAMLKEASMVSRAVLGSQHPESIAIESNLSECWRRQGRYQEAWDMSVATLQRASESLGPKDARTLAIMTIQAQLLYQCGFIQYARTVYSDLVILQRELYGIKDVRTLRSICGQAKCLYELGDRDDAVLILREVVEVSEIHIGTEHTFTVEAMRALKHWQRNGDAVS